MHKWQILTSIFVLLFVCEEVAAGDKVQPVAGTRGRGNRIRQGAVPFVVNGGSHAAQADDAYAIGLHARSSWKCVCVGGGNQLPQARA